MNSTLKIEINGVLITGRIGGIDNFTISYRQNDDDGTVVKSYSSELTFYDDGYLILRNQLINSPTGFNEKASVKIYDDCCGNLVFEGYIMGDSIDWCEPECWISANVIQEDEELACVKNTLIWDNWNGFLNQNYQRIDYCVENRPRFIHALVMYFSALFYAICFYLLYGLIGVVFAIAGIVWVICLIVAAFPGGLTSSDCVRPDVFIDDTWLPLLDAIRDRLLPCRDYHVAPYVRQYIQNACAKCGLNFRSSILNDPNDPVGSIYYNTILLSMQVKKGREASDTDLTMIQDNLPVETLETLFNDYLNPLFNAKWKILGNDFVFERKDYFNGISEWIDADQLLSDGKILENRICWTWQDRQRYAYGRFEYQMDAMEYIGNEAKLQYNDIIDWNMNPYSPAQTGELNRTIPISPLRCVLDNFETSSVLQEITSGPLNINGDYQGYLVMAQHTAFNYKIFIHNTGPETSNEKDVKTNYSDAFVRPFGEDLGCPVSKRYNYPFWFVEGIQGQYGFQNNLYSLFHYIDNPREARSQQFDFSFTFEFDCSQFNGFDFSKYIKISRGNLTLNGQIKEIEVDFNRRTIQVKGSA